MIKEGKDLIMQPRIIITSILLIIISNTAPSLAQFRPDRPSFFRDGNELIEQEIEKLRQQRQNPTNQTENSNELLTIGNQIKWQKYIFKDIGFSIIMPEKTKEDETLNLETPLGKIPFSIFSNSSESYQFLTAYSPILEELNNQNSEDILTAIRDGIANEKKLNLSQEMPILVEGFPGKQLIMVNNNDTIFFRIYIIENRIYILGFNKQEENKLTAEGMGFFDSFELLKEETDS